jgi:hypothetical protein
LKTREEQRSSIGEGKNYSAVELKKKVGQALSMTVEDQEKQR